MYAKRNQINPRIRTNNDIIIANTELATTNKSYGAVETGGTRTREEATRMALRLKLMAMMPRRDSTGE